MARIKYNKQNNEISMATMPVEDDLIERIACNRFWLSSKRKLQGIISLTIIVAIIVGFSVIQHKRSISSPYDNIIVYNEKFIHNQSSAGVANLGESRAGARLPRAN